MLADFCLRLACGLIGALLLLSPSQINPRFYRVHFLTALALSAGAAVFLRETASSWLWATLIASWCLTFLGALAWSLDGAPGGRTCSVFSALALATALCLLPTADFSAGLRNYSGGGRGWLMANELSSALLLGSATTAMLMGHSYLIAPAMSLTPLLRLLGAVFASILIRASVCGLGLWFWTAAHSLTKLDDVTLLLPLRWTLGFVGPIVLAALAWQTARIRSTQSATGILYVVVTLCFLGELISLLLVGMTGAVL